MNDELDEVQDLTDDASIPVVTETEADDDIDQNLGDNDDGSPSTGETDDVEEETSPTYTYQVKAGRIIQMTDGKDAMLQAIDKLLQTVRFAYPIYDEDYGHDLEGLLGKELPYTQTEVKRLLTEALEADDRVLDVEVQDIVPDTKGFLTVTALVTTIYGEISISPEVMINES